MEPFTEPLTEPTADIAGDITRSAPSVGRGWAGRARPASTGRAGLVSGRLCAARLASRPGRSARAGLGTLTSWALVSSDACPVAGPLTGPAGDDPR
jgi:hypothetical protein